MSGRRTKAGFSVRPSLQRGTGLDRTIDGQMVQAPIQVGQGVLLVG